MVNDELLHKWVNGSLRAEELETFKLRPEYESLVTLYKNTAGITAPDFDEKSMLAEILRQEKISVKIPDTVKRRFLSSWTKYAAAASLLIFATWFLWPKNSLVVYEMAKSETKEGVLPDQSMFALNEESTLSYDSYKWKKDRSLNLEGEAFFSVSPGSKFTIITPNGQVQVLGTQFNVWSKNGMLEVKCQSGSVAVLTTEGQLIDELRASDAIRIVADKTAQKWQLQTPDKAKWSRGISSFKKVTLDIVMAELERRFNVKVEMGSVNTQEVFSCNFQHENLELALKTILVPLGIQYEIRNGTKIYLSK